jgi:hypothetical protein
LEIAVPFVIAILTVFISFISNTTVTEVLLRIEKMNSQIADIVAIQTGFNITCMTLLASFNRDTLRNAFSKAQEDKKESALKQLISTFAYCIFVQTAILILGIVYNIFIADLFNLEYIKSINQNLKETISYTFFLLWITVILHSFMVFLRNVTLIYKFILVVFRR